MREKHCKEQGDQKTCTSFSAAKGNWLISETCLSFLLLVLVQLEEADGHLPAFPSQSAGRKLRRKPGRSQQKGSCLTPSSVSCCLRLRAERRGCDVRQGAVSVWDAADKGLHLPSRGQWFMVLLIKSSFTLGRLPFKDPSAIQSFKMLALCKRSGTQR